VSFITSSGNVAAGNFDVLEAKDGLEGLNPSGTNLIMLDFLLPKLSGWGVSADSS